MFIQQILKREILRIAIDLNGLLPLFRPPPLAEGTINKTVLLEAKQLGHRLGTLLSGVHVQHRLTIEQIFAKEAATVLSGIEDEAAEYLRKRPRNSEQAEWSVASCRGQGSNTPLASFQFLTSGSNLTAPRQIHCSAGRRVEWTDCCFDTMQMRAGSTRALRPRHSARRPTYFAISRVLVDMHDSLLTGQALGWCADGETADKFGPIRQYTYKARMWIDHELPAAVERVLVWANGPVKARNGQSVVCQISAGGQLWRS